MEAASIKKTRLFSQVDFVIRIQQTAGKETLKPETLFV
jgi:hypothetical protein